MSKIVPYATTIEVRDGCLCLHAQRAARALARRFDEALRPIGLTNQQFSLLMAVNRPEPPTMRPVADLLGLDQTTLTAAVKPLERRGLLRVEASDADRRRRRLRLTADGHAALLRALPLWRAEHRGIGDAAEGVDMGALRTSLRIVDAAVGRHAAAGVREQL